MTTTDQHAQLSATEPLMIRSDMPREGRSEWQNTDPVYLDKILMDAFTSRSDDEADLARYGLENLKGQCLLHIQRLSDWENVYREYQSEINFEHDEKAFSDVIAFLSGVGASLAGVTQQLGCIHPSKLEEMRRAQADTNAGVSAE